MKIEGDKVVFSTGETKYANQGILGLSPTGEVSQGYDGTFFQPGAEQWNDKPDLTPAECVELADHMIQQWKNFRAQYSAGNLAYPPIWGNFQL